MGALRCPACDTPVLADDISLELKVGLCRPCNSSFDLQAAEASEPVSKAPPARPRARPPEALMDLSAPPKGVTVRTDGEAIEVGWRWFRLDPSFLFLCLWCVLWDGFLVVWYTLGIASFMAGSSEALLVLVFPLLHVAVGIGMTYGLLARMVNRTTLRVDPMRIEVHHGPLFWPRPAVTPTQNVDQLYVVRGATRKQGATGYTLVARLQNRTSVELVKGVPTDVQARYIEQRLESWMGIDDVAVEGEYSG